MSNLNLSRNNKFGLNFSNFPGLSNKDMRELIEAFVHKLEIPAYVLEFTTSRYKGTEILQPVSQKNTDLESFTVTIGVDSNFKNYFSCQQLINKLRYGQIPEGQLNQYNIASINLSYHDNNSNPVKILTFTDAFIEQISSLSLEFGDADLPTFDLTFRYREIQMSDPIT